MSRPNALVKLSKLTEQSVLAAFATAKLFKSERDEENYLFWLRLAMRDNVLAKKLKSLGM
jgi:hypothetical protein